MICTFNAFSKEWVHFICKIQCQYRNFETLYELNLTYNQYENILCSVLKRNFTIGSPLPEENELAICSFHALLQSAGKMLWVLFPEPSSLLRCG